MNWQLVGNSLSNWLFLSFVVGIPLIGYIRKVPVYDTFVLGAKDGFTIILKILPNLIAILVAIQMFRAADGFNLIAKWLGPVLSKIGFPSELLPLALIRPFSGSGSNGILANLVQAHGGDSFIAHAAATMMGSTETTFYVIAVYFGAVAIRRTRHAIPAGLIADLVGVVAAVTVSHWMYAHI